MFFYNDLEYPIELGPRLSHFAGVRRTTAPALGRRSQSLYRQYPIRAAGGCGLETFRERAHQKSDLGRCCRERCFHQHYPGDHIDDPEDLTSGSEETLIVR